MWQCDFNDKIFMREEVEADGDAPHLTNLVFFYPRQEFGLLLKNAAVRLYCFLSVPQEWKVWNVDSQCQMSAGINDCGFKSLSAGEER